MKIMIQIVRSALAVLLVLLVPFNLLSGTYYVDINHSGPTFNGSAENPFKLIQAALDIALSGDTIKVAQGIYNENLTSYESRGCILSGGYQTGNFTNRNAGSYLTTIRGDGTASVLTIDYNGSGGDFQTYEIDGFTIEGGQRGVYASNNGNGGDARLLLSNNIIQNNSGLTDGGENGGGVFSGGMIPEIRNNIIRNNSCGKSGGLSVIFHNTAFPILIDGNIIENNSIYADHGAGAGVQAYNGKISNNTFRNNTILETYGWGGGLLVDGNMFDGFNDEIFIELSNNTYSGNKSPSGGAGLYIDEGANVRMKNELISDNICYDSFLSGALYVDGPKANNYARTIAENITIANNSGQESGNGHAIFVEGGSELIIKNSIFWGNESPDNQNDFYVDELSSLTVDYSIYMTGYLGDGQFNITNSIQADPLFAVPANRDYHLKSQAGRWNPSTNNWITDEVHSQAIDAGDPGSPFNNEPVPNGGRINLGCYGNTEFSSKSNMTVINSDQSSFAKNFKVCPNPIISSGIISFNALAGGKMRVELRNSIGQIVDIPADTFISSGEYHFELSAQNLSTGVYYCVLSIDNNKSIIKFTIIK